MWLIHKKKDIEIHKQEVVLNSVLLKIPISAEELWYTNGQDNKRCLKENVWASCTHPCW